MLYLGGELSEELILEEVKLSRIANREFDMLLAMFDVR